MVHPHGTADLWTNRAPGIFGVDDPAELDLVGNSVEAVDCGIGKVDDATYEAAPQLHRGRHRSSRP